MVSATSCGRALRDVSAPATRLVAAPAAAGVPNFHIVENAALRNPGSALRAPAPQQAAQQLTALWKANALANVMIEWFNPLTATVPMEVSGPSLGEPEITARPMPLCNQPLA